MDYFDQTRYIRLSKNIIDYIFLAQWVDDIYNIKMNINHIWDFKEQYLSIQQAVKLLFLNLDKYLQSYKVS